MHWHVLTQIIKHHKTWNMCFGGCSTALDALSVISLQLFLRHLNPGQSDSSASLPGYRNNRCSQWANHPKWQGSKSLRKTKKKKDANQNLVNTKHQFVEHLSQRTWSITVQTMDWTRVFFKCSATKSYENPTDAMSLGDMSPGVRRSSRGGGVSAMATKILHVWLWLRNGREKKKVFIVQKLAVGRNLLKILYNQLDFVNVGTVGSQPQVGTGAMLSFGQLVPCWRMTSYSWGGSTTSQRRVAPVPTTKDWNKDQAQWF